MTNSLYPNIWELYGLKTNPFFTDPLLLFGGEIDVRLGFVGREEEVRRLQTMIGSRGSSRIIVTGDVGVGKTTFVNYVRANAPKKIFFTPLREIGTQPDWNGIDFILNTISAIYNTFKIRTDLDINSINKEISTKLQLLVDIVEHKDRNFSIDVLGSGIGSGTTTSFSIPQMTIQSLTSFFNEVIKEIRKLCYEEIILSYNNLELFESAQLKKLFDSIRDFTQIKHVKFIFIGDHQVHQALTKRVHSVMSESPIVLSNLSIKEIKELLQKRMQYLESSGLKGIKPYNDEVISKLYSLYDGNLRSILNSLYSAIIELARDSTTPIILTPNEMKKILPFIAKKRWLNKLTEGEQEVLMCILREMPINNKKIAGILKKKPQNISPITNKLLDISAINTKTEGVEKYFSVEPDIKWFLLEEKEKIVDAKDLKNVEKEVQKILDF